MKYYKVLPQYDQKRTRKNNGYFHIANELITEKELEKYGYIKECCKIVNIPKSQIYWFFGARFSNMEV